MQYDTLSGIDRPVSRLIQGTVMVSSGRLEASFTLLDEVLALGCNTFDTAHVYGEGDSERTFGQWVRDRGVRDHIVVIGKGGHHNADRKRVTPFDITADLHDSLARFQFVSIDLYLLHRDDPSVPVGPIIEVLNKHLEAGLIRAFGASNWRHERIAEANAHAARHGLVPFTVSSPQFSLAEQVAEPWPDCITIGGEEGRSARAWYQEAQMSLLTWSSLAGGFFSGRFRRDNLDTFDKYLDRICIAAYASEANFQRLERAEHLAREKGVSLPQIALAYVLNQPMRVFALVGCQDGSEMQANIEAMDIVLTSEEMTWLEYGTGTGSDALH